MAKQGRNAKCACGSEKKFKHCCGSLEVRQDIAVDMILEKFSKQLLEYDVDLRQEAKLKLEEIERRDDLTTEQRFNVEIALVQSLQNLGDHQQALGRVNELVQRRPDDPLLEHLAAKSLERLGDLRQAVELYRRSLPRLKASMGERMHAFALIEYGKACSLIGDGEQALSAWKQAAEWLKGKPEELEHYARALSNIAGEQLKSVDPDVMAQGELAMSDASDLKAEVGDIEGLSNNYSRLSLHYLRVKRYERAIAFARRDLMLARIVGDAHGLASSLGNLAIIYIEMLQLSSARTALAEAKAIGERLDQPSILHMVKTNLAAVASAGRTASQEGRKVGLAADCACGSRKQYQDCCGRADFEPNVTLPGFAGFSQDAADLRGETRTGKPADDWLDHVLRNSEDAKRRFSWSELVGHDGWFEAFEMTDMANLHLIAAQNLANQPTSDAMNYASPLGACILSVCASEAFINAVVYFVADAVEKNPGIDVAASLPPTLIEDRNVYQRHTELTRKWMELGNSLGGGGWVNHDTWEAFKTLVAIRNELVHFKAVGYEQVIPKPKHPHELLRGLPEPISLRDVPHSWPTRLLTPSFAKWCVSTVEQMMDTFRDSYARRKIDSI